VATVGAVAGRGTSWDAAQPWWNSRAVRYLSKRVRPGARAFEWGSGGSTVWLARQGVAVTAVEHDPGWVTKVAARCPGADIRLIPGRTAGRLRSEPELRDKGEHFFDDYIAAVDDIEDDSIDIVIVDGMCRLECVRRGAQKGKPGGMLILDDSDYRFLASAGERLRGWRAVKLSGFKRPLEFRETAFFHKPG